MQDYSLSVEAANLKSVISGACISNVVYSTNFDYFMIFFLYYTSSSSFIFNRYLKIKIFF